MNNRDGNFLAEINRDEQRDENSNFFWFFLKTLYEKNLTTVRTNHYSTIPTPTAQWLASQARVAVTQPWVRRVPLQAFRTYAPWLRLGRAELTDIQSPYYISYVYDKYETDQKIWDRMRTGLVQPGLDQSWLDHNLPLPPAQVAP